MKEPIEQLEEMIRSEIDQLKSDNTTLPNGDKKLANTIRAVAFSDVLIKLLELNEAYHNSAIDAIIEQGRLSESIRHHATQDGITTTNDTQANYGEEKMLKDLSKNKLNQPNK